MSDVPPNAMALRREQLAGILAEKAVALACDVQTDALVAKSAEEKATLVGAFARAARAARQCLALQERFEKGRLAGEREAAAKAREQALKARKAQVRAAVDTRMDEAWPDTGDDEENERYNQRLDDLRDRVDELALDDEDVFLDGDPDELIAQLCRELGVDAALAEAAADPGPPVATDAAAQPEPPPPPSPNGHDAPATDSS